MQHPKVEHDPTAKNREEPANRDVWSDKYDQKGCGKAKVIHYAGDPGAAVPLCLDSCAFALVGRETCIQQLTGSALCSVRRRLCLAPEFCGHTNTFCGRNTLSCPGLKGNRKPIGQIKPAAGCID